MDLAVVYSRVVAGDTLTFGASGWTYERTFILYDHESESMWLPMPEAKPDQTALVCISGKYADTILDEIPSSKIPWNQWKNAHPNTKFMKY